ncbi:MAG: ABC transporter permease [Lachnospiraceae bacterium]|nr:ABC transporter permease [Lachnospiraceae bacterium]
MKKKSIQKILLGLILPILIVVAWFLATNYGNIPSGILPTITKVKDSFQELVHTGTLQKDLLVSFGRVVKGFLMASLLGGVLGSVMGMFEPVRDLFAPIITVVRQIPIIAWIPLIILWCGIGEVSKVVIIVIAAFFQVLVNTESGISGTPGKYVEVAQLYKLSPWETFSKVYLPHAIPQILVGLKLALSVSWMAVVASEMLAATSGIGYRMSNARSMMRADIVIVCMIIIGIVGIVMDRLIGWLFGLLTPWQKYEKKEK